MFKIVMILAVVYLAVIIYSLQASADEIKYNNLKEEYFFNVKKWQALNEIYTDMPNAENLYRLEKQGEVLKNNKKFLEDKGVKLW